jgi:hypothetical protein
VAIETAAALPAWVIHAGAAVVALASTAMVADGRGQWIASLLLIAPIALRPSGALPALFGGWTGLQVTMAGAAMTPLRVAAVVFSIHLLAVLTTATANLPPLTKVELGVLADPVRRLLAIQAIVQPAVWIASDVALRGHSLPWIGVIAAAGLAGLSWVVALRRDAG